MPDKIDSDSQADEPLRQAESTRRDSQSDEQSPLQLAGDLSDTPGAGGLDLPDESQPDQQRGPAAPSPVPPASSPAAPQQGKPPPAQLPSVSVSRRPIWIVPATLIACVVLAALSLWVAPDRLRPKPEVPGSGRLLQSPGTPIDLLKLIDLDLYAVQGDWTFEGEALMSPETGGARLQIPFSPPDEYDLEVVAQRVSGTDGLLLGLAACDYQFHADIDHWQSTVTGLGLVDGKSTWENETTVKTKVFAPGKPTTVVVSVRKSGVDVVCAGRSLVNWRGDYSRLSVADVWAVPNRECLFVGSYETVFRITKMQLTAITGTGKMIELAPSSATTEAEGAKWVQGVGGEVTVTVDGTTNLKIAATEELPNRPLWLTGIDFDERDERLDTKELDKIGGFAHLQELRLQGVPIDDSQLACVRNLTGLGVLWLNHTPITDDGIAHLSELRNLKRLHFECTRLTDRGLDQLGRLNNLCELRLEGTQVTDAGLGQLEKFPGLDWLGLDRTVVTDDGLAQLAELPNLRRLHLNWTAITDVGLAYLEKLPNLEALFVENTNVTREGVERLQAALPQCKIAD